MTNKFVSDAIVAYQVPEPGEEPGEDMIEFLGTYPGWRLRRCSRITTARRN